MHIYRYLPNGQPDSSWAGDGLLRYAIDGNILTFFALSYHSTLDLALQDDGSLLLLLCATAPGSMSSQQISARLLRFFADGTRDFDFGEQGDVDIVGDTSAGSVRIPLIRDVFLSNGHIFLTDYGSHTIDPALYGDPITQTNIWAFHERDGQRDSTWGDNYGIAYITSQDLDWWTTTAPSPFVLSDGRILISGRHRLFCLQPHGKRDSSFGHWGTGIIPVYHNNTLSTPIGHRGYQKLRWAEQEDGKILLFGRMMQSPPIANALSLERMLPNGQIDSSFGQQGVLADIGLGLSNRFSLGGILLDSAGRIVISYTAQEEDTTRNTPDHPLRSWDIVERYLPSGQRDSSFGLNGRIFIDFHESDSINQAYPLFLRSDGLIVFTSAAALESQTVQGRFPISLDVTCLIPDAWFDSSAIDSTGLSLQSTVLEQSLRAYPNPLLGQELNLEYSLEDEASLSYLLYDMQGRLLQYQNAGLRSSGEQREQFYIHPSTAAGNYILEIRAGASRAHIQLQKL